MTSGYAERIAAGRHDPKRRKPRCWACGRLLAEYLTPPWVIRCDRCKATTTMRVDGAARITCKNGHVLDRTTTVEDDQGHRTCRLC